MSAANELMAAVQARLTADAALVALIGPDGLRDRPIAGKRVPCILLGECLTNDYSTATETGEEHLFVLEVWAEAGGRRLADEIADLVRSLLDDAALPLSSQTLVLLQHRSTRTIRDAKAKLHMAEMRFRAVTE